MISVPFTWAHSDVLCVAIVTSRNWMGLWRHRWRRQWLGRVQCTDLEWNLCLECPLRFTPYVIKGIKRFLMHCGDQRHFGLCLGYVPALAYGSCRVSDQGTTLRASDLHNAWATIFNPFNKTQCEIFLSWIRAMSSFCRGVVLLLDILSWNDTQHWLLAVGMAKKKMYY